MAQLSHKAYAHALARGLTCTKWAGATCPQLKMSSEEKPKGPKKDPKTQPQRQKGGKDGGGGAEGSGASAKEAKEAKKKLKAERRVSNIFN